MLLLILDRITALPSPWLEASTVLITWFTLHKEDHVVSTIFKTHPSIPKELARVHKLLSNFSQKELHSIKDEEEQTKLV